MYGQATPASGGAPVTFEAGQPVVLGLGNQVIHWFATDVAGNTSHLDQTINVAPVFTAFNSFQVRDRAHVVINYRTFKAEANPSGTACLPVLLESGKDDPEFNFPDPTPRMWFTPNRHPAGLRVVAGMYRDCQPLMLDVTLSEKFPKTP